MPAPNPSAVESYKVYLKEFWEAEWTEAADLFCNSVTFTSAPTIASAELERRYGRGRRQTDETFSDVPYLNRLGWWVKIELIPWDEEGQPADPIVWVGIIQEDGDNPIGSGAATKPAGVQKILAYGVEIFLERTTVDRSYFAKRDSTAPVRLNRGLTFNEPKRSQSSDGLDKSDYFDRPGNRTSRVGDDGEYLFSGDTRTDVAWTGRDILSYLLLYLTPCDSEGSKQIPLVLDKWGAIDLLPYWSKPLVATDGRRLSEVLGELMDRRRLLGYTVDYDSINNHFLLRPITYADEEIDLGEGRVFMANDDRKSLEFDADVGVEACHVKESETQRYDQVMAVGSRIVVCGTLSPLDGTLTNHWNDDEQSGYNAGASLQEGYGDLETVDQVERDRVARASESFRRVYSYFGLPAEWYGKVGDGVGGTKHDWLSADLTSLPDEGDLNWYLPELRFRRELPLKTDHDYSDDKIELQEVADNTPTGAQWNYRPVYAMMKLPDNPTGGDRYCEVDKIAAACDAELYGDGNGRDFSCSARVQRDAPGVILRVHGGVGPHSIASADFTPIDQYYDWPGTFNWRDNLIVTVAIEADCRVVERWPNDLDPEIEIPKILRIDASRVAELHYVAIGTVVGLADGLPQRTTGGVVRDDRSLLITIARVAHEWYGRRRQAITLTRRGLRVDLRVGDLITSIGSGETSEPIRTVVTELRYDLADNDGATHRTTIQTQWAELDVLKLL